MTEINIITPKGMFGLSDADDLLDTSMRVIGNAFSTEDEWATKYGTNFENDVFMMHRFCWCEREDCPWCSYSDEDGRHLTPAAISKGAVDNAHGSGGAPHFWFKPTGFKLWWYKYIGRDTETHGDLPADFMQQVFATHPKGMTVERAVEDYARREEESANMVAAMFAELNAG